MAKGTCRARASDVVLGVGREHQPLIMIVNGNREDLLRHRLPDDIGVEVLDDLARRGDLAEQRPGTAAAALFLVENRLAQLDALAADIDVARPFYQRPDFTVTLAAERTVRVLLASGAAVPRGEVFTSWHQRSLKDLCQHGG